MTDSRAKRGHPLTYRERITLSCLAAGDSYAEIAATIFDGCSPINVRGAAVRAKTKLGARNVMHAVAMIAAESARAKA